MTLITHASRWKILLLPTRIRASYMAAQCIISGLSASSTRSTTRSAIVCSQYHHNLYVGGSAPSVVHEGENAGEGRTLSTTVGGMQWLRSS